MIVILIMILLTSEPEARELLIAILLIMMILAVVEVILFILLKIGNFGATLALPGDDFLDPSRVEYIDKRSIFGLDTTTNR